MVIKWLLACFSWHAKCWRPLHQMGEKMQEIDRKKEAALQWSCFQFMCGSVFYTQTWWWALIFACKCGDGSADGFHSIHPTTGQQVNIWSTVIDKKREICCLPADHIRHSCRHSWIQSHLRLRLAPCSALTSRPWASLTCRRLSLSVVGKRNETSKSVFFLVGEKNRDNGYLF